MSVKRTVATTRSPASSGPIPTRCALVHSTVTHGSSPTTQASCPGGISKIESGGMSMRLPIVHEDMQDAGDRVPEVVDLAALGCPSWVRGRRTIASPDSSASGRRSSRRARRPRRDPFENLRTRRAGRSSCIGSRGMRGALHIKRCSRSEDAVMPPRLVPRPPNPTAVAVNVAVSDAGKPHAPEISRHPSGEYLDNGGEPAGIRTQDTRIKSPLL